MKILMTGGGTGGHIYPALAFINYVKSLDHGDEFMYVGTKDGLESKIVPQYDIPFETIEIQGFKRSLSLQNFKTIYLFLSSIKKAKKLLREFKPDVVIGTGGYVSGSVVYAASQLKIPTIVHEQNSIPGMTNKFLSRYATKVAICFSCVSSYFPSNKSVLTGNPRAQEVASMKKTDVLSRYGLSVDKKTAVIFGGSRGALKINQAFTEALPSFKGKEYQVLYASGSRYYEELECQMKQLGEEVHNVSVQPYLDDMAEVLASTDLVVSRAGATSIAEFTALGLPAILIPSPYVTNDHQTKNAENLVEVGAVQMIANDELTGTKLLESIDSIFSDDALRASMASASKSEGIPNAAERLYHVVESITG